MKDFLTPTELAETSGVARQTIYNWLRRKRLPFKSLGKHYRIHIPKKWIPEFLVKHGNK